MDEVIAEFLVESYENLDQLDRDLITLEDRPDARDVLAGIFRTIHTIKGTCGFLGYSQLESVAHVGENLLSKLRDGELSVTPEIATGLLQLGDAVRAMLASIERSGAEGERDDSALVATLVALHDGTAVEVPAMATIPAPEEETIAEPGAAPAPAPAPVAAAAPEPAEGRASPVADTTIRVDVGLLDDLMNLVGELVLARNQIVQLTADAGDGSLASSAQRLNLITTELQESAMKTRMQPIGNVWSKFPRVVRDLAVTCGKSVRLAMEGEDTELDKTLLESIKDPLTHLVRNAVDHGIEAADAREAAGKPREGTLTLRAFHEGGQVNVEIGDDGGGIDPEKIRRKAIERGLVTTEQAARLGDREVLNLIFAPGFSTAEQVTNVSGRGVGMDVVKTNIERIGGSVDVSSEVGAGTTFRVRIPLTLAIIPALIVRSDGDRYAIPQVSLLELVGLEGETAKGAIEDIHGAPVYRLRGHLLPLVDLRGELGGASLLSQLGTPEAPSATIVVLQADGREFGLVVEGVSDSAEIVVKPLSHYLKGIATYAGATIMGDGRVGLILDVMGLAAHSGVVSETTERSKVSAVEADLEDANRQTLLVFRTPDDGRMAIPLEAVDRLEEFPRSAIEHTGDHEVVQYRGTIMPLVHVAAGLPERRVLPRSDVGSHEGISDTVQVVVHQHRGRAVGLVVEAILDIVEESGPVEPASRPGVFGTMVIGERVTELLSLADLLAGTYEHVEVSA
jgi:two-component system chemotaxis sensor kinase CheA